MRNETDGKVKNVKKILAIKDYEAEENSELTFDAGDIILLLDGPDKDGLCFGKHVIFGLEGESYCVIHVSDCVQKKIVREPI